MCGMLLKIIVSTFIIIIAVGILLSSIYPNDADQLRKTLEIDEKDIPTIKCPDILEGALKSAGGYMKNPLNIAKKIVNAYTTAPKAVQTDASSDLRIISLYFYELWTKIEPTKIWREPRIKDEDILTKLRHSFAHDNYFYSLPTDGQNRTSYQTLEKNLQSSGLIIPGDTKADDWILWNIWYGLNICFVISNTKLVALFEKFTIDCRKMITKSKKNNS